LPIDELNEEQYLLQDWEKYDAEKDEFEIKQLQKGLNQLGEQCKKILDLFYYQSKNLAAICKLLNYENTDVVKSQKSRCLKQLKQIING
jgi:DNA-directed RNA polymerase specialized sigma subunit